MMTTRVFRDTGSAGDIHLMGHAGVQFAFLESAVADGVQNAAKLMAIEKLAQFLFVFDVERNDTGPGQPPGFLRPNANHLIGIAFDQVMKGVEARDARNAGNEHGKRRGATRDARMNGNNLRCFRPGKRAIALNFCPSYRMSRHSAVDLQGRGSVPAAFFP